MGRCAPTKFNCAGLKPAATFALLRSARQFTQSLYRCDVEVADVYEVAGYGGGCGH
jgi:hypothetical protein